MPAKERCLQKEKASNVKAKANSLSGDQHAMTTGSLAVAHKAIIVQSIIRDDSQVDVQYAVLPNMPPHSVLVRSNPRPRMPNGMSLSGNWDESEWQEDQWETEEYEASKGKKGKGKGSKPRGQI